MLDLAFFAAVLIDYARTPRPETLDLRRKLPARAGLGQPFTRIVRIDTTRTPRAGGCRVEIDEQFSPALAVVSRAADPLTITSEARTVKNAAPLADDPSGGPDVARLPTSGQLDFPRVYRAALRGVHGVGDLRVRLTGPWSLVQRAGRLRGEKTIQIEPALLSLRKSLKLAASERWRDLGVRTTRRRGGMTEFESLRDHVIGDDVRLVDWKAFAKRGRPIVRQFQEERGQELILVIDCGRRMAATTAEELPRAKGARFGVARGATKLDHALDAALELAAVALQEGDRVGLMAYDSQPRAWIPPARGRAHFGVLRNGVFALEARDHESDLARALKELSTRHRRRALVLILSDVADPLSVERQRTALRAGSRRHRIVFTGLDDPILRAFADRRAAADGALRAASLELLEERRVALRRLAGAGVRALDAVPAEAAAPMIAAWFDERRRL
ncbi:MAG: DUF58 domain-containing protein [Planctomycetes bacterium]|nr:DUF58 domain-containing protein [Planctomycetota bacterium]